MKSTISIFLISAILLTGCNEKQQAKSGYFDYSKSDDQITGGVKMIPITTPKGTFNVW